MKLLIEVQWQEGKDVVLGGLNGIALQKKGMKSRMCFEITKNILVVLGLLNFAWHKRCL